MEGRKMNGKAIQKRKLMRLVLEKEFGQVEEYIEKRNKRNKEGDKKKEKINVICMYVPSLYVPNRDFIFDAVTEELIDIEYRNFSKGINYQNKTKGDYYG